MSQQSQPGRGSIGLTIIILLVSAGIAYLLLKSGPEVSPDEETPVAKMVKVRKIEPDRYPISVSAYGTVIPARRVTIEPEVSGLVIQQHQNLSPGGKIMKGEELFTIDPTMAELTLKESNAALKRAEVNLKEAQRKFIEAQSLASNALIPDTELTSLEADALVQEAEVARLNVAKERNVELLKRHVIKAPFNAIVLDEDLEIGQRIDPGFSAATLIGADEYWIQVSLPVDQIRHIQLPEGFKRRSSNQYFPYIWG
jgi:multidrug efflux pump subunit AcrA (membrane-fusion protein)